MFYNCAFFSVKSILTTDFERRGVTSSFHRTLALMFLSFYLSLCPMFHSNSLFTFLEK